MNIQQNVIMSMTMITSMTTNMKNTVFCTHMNFKLKKMKLTMVKVLSVFTMKMSKVMSRKKWLKEKTWTEMIPKWTKPNLF